MERERRRRKGAQARRRVRTSITWDEATLKRLEHYCVETRRDRNDVLAELVDRHLTRFVVADRGGPDRDRREDDRGGGEGPTPLNVVA
ncbi:hypothetical protein [Tautonia plasticadhaerens]|uniref:Ribbon-helix-helix protein CopG domain-containing protein n=1 Tax=Tautonia plasticadhaerens TaxID=2527974 RepID=A0A518GZK2_9BACT|nr:hypothetical protein [Tautonia plasticadhaerens]QDV34001.1 hypothetical protein ElP_18820 [Tautonia plasticadhaerens]